MSKMRRDVIEKKSLKEARRDDGFLPGTMAERIAAVWEITKNTWAFVPNGNPQQRLQRHIAVLIKRKG